MASLAAQLSLKDQLADAKKLYQEADENDADDTAELFKKYRELKKELKEAEATAAAAASQAEAAAEPDAAKPDGDAVPEFACDAFKDERPPSWDDFDEFDIRAGAVPEGFVPNAEQAAAVKELGPYVEPAWADIDEFTIREWYFGGKPNPDPYEMVPDGFVPTAEQIALVEALGDPAADAKYPAWEDIDEFTMREWYFGGKPDPDPYEMVPPGFVPNAEQIAAVEALGPSK